MTSEERDKLSSLLCDRMNKESNRTEFVKLLIELEHLLAMQQLSVPPKPSVQSK